MKYLLDTNVLRELGKTSSHKNVAAWLTGVDDADLAISALTVREIAKGVAKLGKTKPETAAALDATVSAIFDAFEGRILPIDRPVAAAWGEALGESDKHIDDAGLAATANGGDRRNAARRLGKSHDGGVDGVIDEDRLGLDRIYVQAKRYAPTTSVGRPEVQGFVGSLVGLGAHKGVFVTTSGFSQGAIDYASRLAQRVILIEGQRLAELMIEHNVGVRVSRTVEVKRLDEDFFADEG